MAAAQADGQHRARVRVTAAGLLTTVQDLGRFGYGRFGLPVAGALDDLALRWANLLVGNEAGAAALEITLAGPTLILEGDQPLLAALTGADFSATLGARQLSPWRSFHWQPGEALTLGACQTGMRGYLAIAGGIAVPPVFGSRSTDLLGAIGGLEGRALRPGDLLPLAPPAAPFAERQLPPALVPRYTHELAVRVVLGPQDERFTEDAIVTFLSSPYTVTREADRMGVRLDGPGLLAPGGADIVSEGVVTGAIQAPAHGRPIVLLGGRQTTGGYPKIATVIGADLWRMGQARPGDVVRFKRVALTEAQEVLRAYRARFDPADLTPVSLEQAEAAPGTLDTGGDAVADVREQVAGLVRALGERLGTPPPEREGAATSSPVWRPEDVRALLDHFAQLGLAEFAIEAPGLQLRLRRDGAPEVATSAVAASPPPDEFTVTAPFLGVLYRATQPGEAPLVATGDVVAPDQPLALIEVMKTLHPVTAGRRARVVAVLAEDATPVEYGQPLFTLRAERA